MESPEEEAQEQGVLDSLTFQIFELAKMQTRKPSTVCAVMARCLIYAAMAANIPKEICVLAFREHWDGVVHQMRTEGE